MSNIHKKNTEQKAKEQRKMGVAEQVTKWYNKFRIAQGNEEIKKLLKTFIEKNLNNPDLKKRLYSVNNSEEILIKNLNSPDD